MEKIYTSKQSELSRKLGSKFSPLLVLSTISQCIVHTVNSRFKDTLLF